MLSLAELPALMTHSTIPPTERAMLGIGDDLIRLSVSIEEGADLVSDIEQALHAAVERHIWSMNNSRVSGEERKKFRARTLKRNHLKFTHIIG